MPARRRSGAPVSSHIYCFLGGSQRGYFSGIKTDGNHLKLLTDIESQGLETAHQTVQHLSAEHRAVIVNQSQKHRLAAEVFSKLDRTSGFVSKPQLERHWRV